MPASNESELQLIARSRRGDRDAFRALVLNYQDQVYRVCCLILGDSSFGQDLAQDTFVRAHGKLHLFDPEKGSFATWLLTMARRLCLNACQRRGRTIALEDPPDHASPPAQQPDRRAIQTDTAEALDRALADLPTDFRTAFVLAEIEDLPLQKIAELEGVALGTIKSRIHRAKEALRSQLQTTFDEWKTTTT